MRTEMPGNAGHSDPRSYMVIQPLPIPSQKGLKIQARSATHYNCWVPCRDEIFRDSYYRRQRQLSQQGYNSPNYKPFEELGQPLFLEVKKLILQSLGQDELVIDVYLVFVYVINTRLFLLLPVHGLLEFSAAEH